MAYLRLLGGASLEREGAPFSGPEAQRHRIALLALLASAHPHGVQRDKLLCVLWPEREPERARNLLNQAIHHLRKALGSEAITSSGGELRLEPEVIPCDLVAFRQALEAGHRQEAVRSYGGPFLDGFHLGGSGSFEHWLEEERSRLAHAFHETLESLADDAEARNDHAEAVSWWSLRASDEPLNSRVAVRYAQAMEVHGDVAGAIRHLRIHEQLLSEELGVEPTDGVRALQATLREGRAASHVSGIEAVSPESGAHGASQGEEAVRQGEEAVLRHEASPERTGPVASGTARLRWAGWAGGGLLVGALGVGALAQTGLPDSGGEDDAVPSLVVLPFQHIGPEDEAHRAAGVREDLTAGLAGAPDVSVVAPSAADPYGPHGDVDLEAVWDELEVDYVVTGSVRWDEGGDGTGRLHVTPRLLSLPDGVHVWASSFQREDQQLFELNQEVAGDILRELGASVSGELSSGEFPGPTTDDLEAYDHYLQGTAYLARQFSQEAAHAAIAQYQRAVELDPGFAEAWRHLIQTRVRLGWVFDDEEEAPLAASDLARLEAQGIDDPEVSLARGWYLYYGERRYEEALEEFESVRRARPEDGEILRVIGFLEQRIGDQERALETKRRALELSPRDAELAYSIGQQLVTMGRYDEAPYYYQRAFSLAPDQDIAFLFEGYERLHTALGDTAEADAVRERARSLGGPAWMGGRAELYAGDPSMALERLREHRPSGGMALLAWYDNLADVHGRLGDDGRQRGYADSLLATAREMAPEAWDRPRTQAANAAWVFVGLAHLHRGEREAGLEQVRRGLRQEAPFGDALVEPFVQSLSARAFMRAGIPEEALDLLEASGVVPGAFSREDLRSDPEWDPVRDHRRFTRLVEPD